MNQCASQLPVETPSSGLDIERFKAWGMGLLIVGLSFGIFALRFPMIVLASLGASAVVFAVLACVRPIHSISVWVLLNYVYWLFTGMVSHGVTLSSLTNTDFWRGEGRCFFFYLPLLTLAIMHVRQRDLKFIVKIVVVLTVIGAILGLLWIAGLGHFFQTVEEENGERIDSIYYIGLLTSHTGAGAFWATVAAFLVGYAWSRKQRSLQVLAVIAAFLMIATGGRAATLGLMGALVWLLIRGEILQRRTMLVGGFTIALTGIGAVYIGSRVPEISERMGEMVSPAAARSIKAIIEQPTLQDASGYFFSGADLPHHNLVIRVYLWKYALQLARTSPLTGIGFGRFNDCYLEYAGIPHVACFAVKGERYYGSGIRWEGEQLMSSTGNAHNSYLHILAETGIIGLGLFLILWIKIFIGLKPVSRTKRSDDFDRAYAVGCQAMVVCLGISALAGHALGAPSGGILLTMMIGAWLSYKQRSGQPVTADAIAN